MSTKRMGRQTVALAAPPSVVSFANIGGKFEGEETPDECLVVEDAVSGAQAGHAGGFRVACVGDASEAQAGDFNLSAFSELLEIVRSLM